MLLYVDSIFNHYHLARNQLRMPETPPNSHNKYMNTECSIIVYEIPFPCSAMLLYTKKIGKRENQAKILCLSNCF